MNYFSLSGRGSVICISTLAIMLNTIVFCKASEPLDERPLLVISDGSNAMGRIDMTKNPKGNQQYSRNDPQGFESTIRWSYLGNSNTGARYHIDLLLSMPNGEKILRSTIVTYSGMAISVVEQEPVRIRILPVRRSDVQNARAKPRMIIRDKELGLRIPVDLADGSEGSQTLSRGVPPVPTRIVRWTYLGSKNDIELYQIIIEIKDNNKRERMIWTSTVNYSGKNSPISEFGPISVQIISDNAKN